MKEKNRHHFFAFLSRMKYINRWGLMRNTISENIQEHSLEVAIIAHALAVIRNTCFNGKLEPDRAAVMGMFHDCNETITGDMPTPIKYYSSEIHKAYQKVEDISREKLLSMLPEELKPSYKSLLFEEEQDKEIWELVKAADRIAAYIKCIEEEKSGNKEFKKAEKAIVKDIHLNTSEEVKYFMEKLMPSFFLTLDELD